MKPQDDVNRSARLVWLLAMLAVYLGAFASGATGLIGTLNDDAVIMEQMAGTGVAADFARAVNEPNGSYAVMAFFYAHTSAIERVVIEVAAGVMFILFCMGSLRTHRALSLMAFCLIGPIMFFLMMFNKDTIVAFVSLSSAVVLRSYKPTIFKIIFVIAVYAIYARVFREYYFLIVAIFLCLFVVRRAPPLFGVAILFAAVAVLVLLPKGVFMSLESSRDLFNLDRIGRSVPGARTAFGNVYPPDSPLHFILNYCYAFIRLNFPFFSGVTVRDIYMFANVIVFAWMIIVGLKSDRKTSDSAALFLSHVLVSICFEPDVGSYLRHVSSALPYLVPPLMVMDRAWSAQARAQTAHQVLRTAGDRGASTSTR